MGKLRKPARKLAEGCRDGIQKYVCASHAVRVAMSANAMGGHLGQHCGASTLTGKW